MSASEDVVRKWLATTLSDSNFTQTKNSLFDLLKDGVSLCKLLNILGVATSEYKKKPNNKQSRENVDIFLQGIWTLELDLAEQPTSYESLFPSNKDTSALLETLAALKSYQSSEDEVEKVRTSVALVSPVAMPQMTQLDDFSRQTMKPRNSTESGQETPLESVRMSAASFSMSEDVINKVTEWIFAVLKQKPKKITLNKLLMEGTTMLDILNAIRPGCVKSKKHFRFGKTFDAYQKTLIEKFNIAPEDIIRESDIDSKFNPKKIAAHFYVLCHVAKTKFGYRGPTLLPKDSDDGSKPAGVSLDAMTGSGKRLTFAQRATTAADAEAEQHVLLEWASSKMQECDSRGMKKKNWSKLTLADFKDCTIFLILLEYLTGSSVGYFYRSPHNAKEIQHNANQLFIFAPAHMDIPPDVTSTAVLSDSNHAILKLLDAIRQHFDLDYMFQIAIQDKNALQEFNEEAEKIMKKKMKVSVPIGSHRSIMVKKETPQSPRVQRQKNNSSLSIICGDSSIPLSGPAATSWPSLMIVLSDPMLRGDLCAYLESEGVIAYLMFYEEAYCFKQSQLSAASQPPGSLRIKADRMALDYFSEGGASPLNLSWDSKSDVLTKLRSCGNDVPDDLWDKAFAEVDEIIRSNLFVAWASGLQPPKNVEMDAGMDINEFADIEQLSEAAMKVLIAKESVRNHAIEHFLRSERQYVQHLVACVEQVEIPIADAGLLNDDELYQAFNVLRLLQVYHKNLLNRLEEAAAQRKEGKMAMFGQVFLENTGFLLLYSLYCRNYTRSTLYLRQTLSVNPAIDAIVKKFESSAGNNIIIHDVLALPARRIGVYESLFSSVLKFTPELHPDYESVQYCLSLVSKLASDIMDCQDEGEARTLEMMLHLADSIKPDPAHPLIVPNRKLVYYGDVTIVRISDSGNTLTPEGVEEECMIVLFNDLIVCCSRVEDCKYSYVIADCIKIDAIEEITVETVMKPFVQLVAKNGESWIFSSTDGPERTEAWSKIINSLCPSAQQS